MAESLEGKEKKSKSKGKESDIETQAIEEILKEAKRSAEIAKECGSWLKPAIPPTNKRFLRNMLVSTLRHTRGPRPEEESSTSSDSDSHGSKYRQSKKDRNRFSKHSNHRDRYSTERKSSSRSRSRSHSPQSHSGKSRRSRSHSPKGKKKYRNSPEKDSSHFEKHHKSQNSDHERDIDPEFDARNYRYSSNKSNDKIEYSDTEEQYVKSRHQSYRHKSPQDRHFRYRGNGSRGKNMWARYTRRPPRGRYRGTFRLHSDPHIISQCPSHIVPYIQHDLRVLYDPADPLSPFYEDPIIKHDYRLFQTDSSDECEDSDSESKKHKKHKRKKKKSKKKKKKKEKKEKLKLIDNDINGSNDDDDDDDDDDEENSVELEEIVEEVIEEEEIDGEEEEVVEEIVEEIFEDESSENEEEMVQNKSSENDTESDVTMEKDIESMNSEESDSDVEYIPDSQVFTMKRPRSAQLSI